MSFPSWDVVGSFLRKESGPAAVAGAVVVGAYLFVPQLKALGPREWDTRALGAFLALSAVALSRCIAWAIEQAGAAWKRKRESDEHLDLIRNLNPDAKRILAQLLRDGTVCMDLRDANVSILHAMGLTFHPGLSYMGSKMDYAIQPSARRLLAERPELLAGAAKDLPPPSRPGRG